MPPFFSPIVSASTAEKAVCGKQLSSPCSSETRKTIYASFFAAVDQRIHVFNVDVPLSAISVSTRVGPPGSSGTAFTTTT